MTRRRVDVEIDIWLVGSAETGHRGLVVQYRFGGGARVRFRCILSAGQSLNDGLSVALAVIDRDPAGRVTGEQLRLDMAAGAAA